MLIYYLNRIRNSNLIILLLSDTSLIIFAFFISILLRYDFYFPSELKFTLEKKFLPGLIILKIFRFKAFNLYRGIGDILVSLI